MKAINKDIVRELKKSRLRFFYILAIIALGTAFFTGLKATAPSMKETAVQYFQDSRLADLHVQSGYGFKQSDIDALKQEKGAADAAGSYSMDVVTKSGEHKFVTRIMSYQGTDGMNIPELLEGRMPENENECLLEKPVKNHTTVEIGGQIEVTDESQTEDTLSHLTTRTFTVVGYVRDPLYISIERGSTNVGKGTLDNYIIVLESSFNYERYTDAWILSDATVSGVSPFSDEYDTDMDTLKAETEATGDRLNQEQYADIKKEADQKISDSEKELADAQEEFDTGIADGQAQLDDAQEQLDAAAVEIADAQSSYDSGKQKLDDSEAQYAQGLSTLQDSQSQLDASLSQLEDAESQYQAGKDKLDASEDQYAQGLAEYQSQAAAAEEKLQQARDGISQLDDGIAQAQSGIDQLNEQKQQIEDGITQLEDGISQIESGIAQLTAEIDKCQADIDEVEAALAADPGSQELQDQLETLKTQKSSLETQKQESEDQKQALEGQLAQAQAQADQVLPVIEENIATTQSTIDSLTAQRDSLQQQLDAGEAELAAGQEKLDQSRAQLDAGWAELNASREQLDSARAQYNDGKAQLDAGWAELASSRSQLDAGWAELQSGKEQLDSAVSQYQQSVDELEQGKAELADQKAEGQIKLDDAQKQIDDAKKQVSDLTVAKFYVYTRDDSAGYSGYGEDATRIGNVANVFPLFFLLVAMLVAFSTMTRMVEEERSEIGCLMALGYSRMQILKKYIVYAGLAAIIGGIGGTVFGISFFPEVIFYAYGLLYSMPSLVTVIPWDAVLGSMAVALACTVGAAAAIALYEMHAVPAELMLPKAPKPGKRVFLERITPLWNRLNFITKISSRNILRYKARFFMTVLGIAGCTALILAGFGLHDSIFSIIPSQFSNIQKFDDTVVFKDETDAAGKQDILSYMKNDDRVSGVLLASQHQMNARTSDTRTSVQTYLVVPENPDKLTDFVSLHPRKDDNNILPLESEGAVINEKTSTTLGIGIGDEITVYDDDSSFTVPVTGIMENYLQNYVYMSPQAYKAATGKDVQFNLAYMNLTPDGLNDENTLLEKLTGREEILTVTPTENLVNASNDSLSSLNLIVVVMVVSAGALAFIVLYNLTNINISERIREIATLKVLGFYPKETDRYIFRENVALSIIGMLLGLVLGVMLLNFIILTVETDIVMFGRDIFWQSYIYACALTILFTYIVNYSMVPVINRVDMVEALKSNE
ncbi:MAG: FtsX-like permease family protein [Eubacteriaceae bacterium]|jgi:putative ABC transport system permease protein